MSDFDFKGFLFHWIFVAIGIFLYMVMPILISWTNPNNTVFFLRWWVFLIIALLGALVGGGLNWSLPRTPPMMLNSICFGFACGSVVASIVQTAHA